MNHRKWITGPYLPKFPRLLLLLPLVAGVALPSQVQTALPPEGLAVGQPLPELTLRNLVQYPFPTAKLSDFKGKLLLLEFWATWCGSCKASVPKMDSLQRQFPDGLQVLLVSYPGARDDRASVLAFFEKWRRPDGTRYALPSVVEDTSLVKLFPHRLIPHFAWIRPDGTVGAVTGPDKVTAANVARALSDGVMPPSALKDIDLRQPLLASPGLPPGSLLHYSVLVKGKLENAPGGMLLRQDGDKVTGVVFTNMSLLALYRIAKRHLYPEMGDRGLSLTGVDSADLFPGNSGLSAAAWKENHLYSYDLLLPPGQEAALYQTLLEDLNRYSGYRATRELIETDCLVLVRRGRRDRLLSRGGPPANRLYQAEAPFLHNLPLSFLVARLNSNNSLPLPVVDGTRYPGPVDLTLPDGITDLPSLRRELRLHGLDLKPARRKVPFLVVRKDQLMNL